MTWNNYSHSEAHTVSVRVCVCKRVEHMHFSVSNPPHHTHTQSNLQFVSLMCAAHLSVSPSLSLCHWVWPRLQGWLSKCKTSETDWQKTTDVAARCAKGDGSCMRPQTVNTSMNTLLFLKETVTPTLTASSSSTCFYVFLSQFHHIVPTFCLHYISYGI